ncbi:MAG: PD-(D/E)XK nuclease family protein [Candidatus Binatia bacterium]
MQTILGPFHPDLENALVDAIAKHKATDLLSPLLILVPSDLLRRRLKIHLARERGWALLNVQLLTFHQLSLRLNAECGNAPTTLHSDLFLEEALRQIIRTGQPGAEPFVGIEDRAGGCAALWQTLRDLRDGLVDPALALVALSEGHFSQRTGERTAQLLSLLQTLQHFCDDQGIRDLSDLDRRATEQAPASLFLQQFTEILYYGFYDLTQIQLDFFLAVARHYPTKLFFPLLPVKPSHDAWTFAARFYERYVQGHTSESVGDAESNSPLPTSARLFDGDKSRNYAQTNKKWHCQIVNTFGIQDEVATSAKEILRLVDDGKLTFHEIGVVVRGLESYGTVIRDCFAQHRIPLAGRLEEPLVLFPLTKAVILLLNLPAKDFLRSQVIDLLSSPYFQLHELAADPAHARPDLWDLATRELAICNGVDEWRRLRRFTQRDLLLRQLSDDDEARVIRIAAAQLLSLADVVDALVADLAGLPSTATWHDYSSRWKSLLKKYLGISSSDEIGTAEASANNAILELLGQLAGLDKIHDNVSLGDFSHTFEHWLERTTVIEDRRNRDGVVVLGATAARGLSFRALFVLGMNEGMFPRTIREDAFLRDRDREILESDLGYKVNQKLTGYDEEKLLFSLLVGAGRERLYCSYQRADDNGRALAPSWYVEELKQALASQGHDCESVTIPRSLIDKATTAPFDRQDLLLPGELAVQLTLQNQDPTSVIEATGNLPALYREGRKIISELDRSGDRLLSYDGLVGELAGHWRHFAERGLSPTALETYARCPFQFFARHVLGLQPLDRPEEVLGPNAAEFGELGHEILNGFYAALMEGGYFTGKTPAMNIENTLSVVANQAFADYEANNPVGYPLAWETLKEGLIQLLRQVTGEDLKELSSSGFAPVSLETDMTRSLPDDWPDSLKGLTIRGRMDRIDRNVRNERDGNALRVIDYKFKFGAAPATQDKNLVRAALRGERLQPPFYYLLAQAWAERQGGKSAPAIEADFYYIAQRWLDGPLFRAPYDRDGLSGNLGAATKETIEYLANGVRQGRYFIHRGEYCGHCDFATLCRKNHPPSLWRAENDPLTEAHYALRVKDPKKL